ncbi:MAG: mercuric transporter MerT family protein [Sulfurospirillaceae bacterium]|nr:mercuric transporter MerT family protein [Sulfurospirillaceae bacterium]MDD2826803.1 mercuric transporter MerT family protein [Sulfurospirillaceae bacterium]
MKKEVAGIIGALVSAFLATACCLPPLLFLLFGISFGFLGFLETLTPFRIPLSLLSLGILYLSYRAYSQECLTCRLEKRKKNRIIYGIVLGIIVMMLLYPEVANLLFEE